MHFPGTRMPFPLLILCLAASRCLSVDEADQANQPPLVPLPGPPAISSTTSLLPPVFVTKIGESVLFKNEPELKIHSVQEKKSNTTIMKHSVIEFSASADITVVVEQSTNIALSCELSSEESTVQTPIQVMWMFDDEKINGTEFAHNKTHWHTWYTFSVRDSSQMGNYSCIFKSELEAKATFHVKVPKVKGGDKPMVSYEGDTVVMKCDTLKHKPLTWIWYRSEGNDKVALNDSLMSSKYEITRKHVNESKLHIKELSGNDSGLYWCEAVFPTGESRGKINLNVLSYMVPLKPFLAIAAEVIILVAVILIYEMHTKKKQASTGEDEKEAEQSEHLKPEDYNGVENDSTRHRKV
ncbi:embigin [Ambystoma mexicanum]|uniref:embigin n=1 Tax=Ambystoma mexicanum TaxID=8296 RepID=UPI0037E80DF6